MQELTNKELEIVSLIWKEGRPLAAVEILELLPDKTWKDSTIHLILNGLLDKGVIEVDGMSLSGRTYARHFKTTISMEDYHAQQIQHSGAYKKDKKKKLPGIFAALMKDDDINDETLREIEALIEAKRKELDQ